jgi:DNA polymerase III epsilon subunit-like protein
VRIDRLHVIDFEGHPRYGVVEYGVVTLGAGGIETTATGLCAPTGEIPPADTRVHGIDRTMAEGRAPFAVEYERFVALRRTGLFVAHNASVEHNLLKATWAFPPFVPGWLETGGEVADWGPWLDTLVLARALDATAESHALEALSYGSALKERIDALARVHCPEVRRRPHCALYDALATAVWLEATTGFAAAVDWFQRSQPGGQAQGELF